MAITDSISPLDDGYMRLGHVAMLMAEENEHRAYEDIMDRFKRAVFAGELEPPSDKSPATYDGPLSESRRGRSCGGASSRPEACRASASVSVTSSALMVVQSFQATM
jgi:hypothetical protein